MKLMRLRVLISFAAISLTVHVVEATETAVQISIDGSAEHAILNTNGNFIGRETDGFHEIVPPHVDPNVGQVLLERNLSAAAGSASQPQRTFEQLRKWAASAPVSLLGPQARTTTRHHLWSVISEM